MRVALSIVLALAAGCSVTDPVPGTLGLTLEMQVEDEGNFAVIYRLNPDRTLSFSGGADVRDNETTWAGMMTNEEIETLYGLLHEHHWLDGGPADAEMPSDRVTRIHLRWPGGRLHTTVRGRSADVSPVEAHLSRIANRRLEPYLESLPKARTPPDEP